MSKYKLIKEEAFEANMQLPKLGLVLFTFGNASAADRDLGVFAIKPSGVPYQNLRAEDMVVMDFDGQLIEGELRPSSDTKTHAALYKEMNQIAGVAHTHSTYATAWAQANLDIPILGTTHADHLTHDIPCAPPMSDDSIAGDYENNTAYQIIDYLKLQGLDYREVEMILVGNHAPFSWGPTAQQAVYNSAICEACAQMAYLTMQINPKAERLKESLVRKHYERKHGNDAYYGQGS